MLVNVLCLGIRVDSLTSNVRRKQGTTYSCSACLVKAKKQVLLIFLSQANLVRKLERELIHACSRLKEMEGSKPRDVFCPS